MKIPPQASALLAETLTWVTDMARPIGKEALYLGASEKAVLAFLPRPGDTLRLRLHAWARHPQCCTV